MKYRTWPLSGPVPRRPRRWDADRSKPHCVSLRLLKKDTIFHHCRWAPTTCGDYLLYTGRARTVENRTPRHLPSN
ncbi:hypothetical protein NDU88_006580 [Pleurodeles waltl]|uniref:Uncharacterized protein n=1 Tax=Pleurodeles waltl TaxID=8319 RepID=A0AAV7VQ20_PLEWA|nr:hypothetical protein NDU88_006580 [Pleurodeles waltl]